MGNVVLDYNQKTAKWLWDTTTKSLYADAKDKFESPSDTGPHMAY